MPAPLTRRLAFLFLALLAGAGASVRAAEPAAAQRHAAIAPTEAVVRKVDPAERTVTLKHGAIPNLGMGAMTMVFTVPDAALLTGLRAGDRVRFTADQVGEDFVVRTLERVPR